MPRRAAFAGSFYPLKREELEAVIKGFMEDADIEKVGDLVSLVAPHAGYIYSGSVAAYSYKALSAWLSGIGQNRDMTFVLIGPNHTGYGTALSLSPDDWETPLGKVANDRELTSRLVEYSDMLSVERMAHLSEHSIEVQLPFLQNVVKNPRCIFLCMGDQSHESSMLVAEALHSASEESGKRLFVIASSDFNHYESAEAAKLKDMPAIRLIEKLDAEGFADAIGRSGDTACGYGPISVAALYAGMQGNSEGRLLRYSNSGTETGDYSSVVAYASILFEKARLGKA